MFERPKVGEKAVLVHVDMDIKADPEELEEFRELVVSAGATPVCLVTGSRRSPDPRLFIGSGKAEEVRDLIQAEEAELVISIKI